MAERGFEADQRLVVSRFPSGQTCSRPAIVISTVNITSHHVTFSLHLKHGRRCNCSQRILHFFDFICPGSVFSSVKLLHSQVGSQGHQVQIARLGVWAAMRITYACEAKEGGRNPKPDFGGTARVL